MDRLEEQFEIRRIATSTRKSYRIHCRSFVVFHRRSPAEMGPDDIEAYMRNLARDRKVLRSTQAQALAAKKFMCRVALRKPSVVSDLRSPQTTSRAGLTQPLWDTSFNLTAGGGFCPRCGGRRMKEGAANLR